MSAGTVFLVGAGPGDPELITLRGASALSRADVVVYDGLANALLLDHAPPAAERIYAGKKHSDHGAPLTQADIDAILIERARRGLTVVRLKGGDPFVFGRGGEEAVALAAAGIPFEVVPGVTAATAVPAYAGIPLTHRDVASTVIALATGHEAEGTSGHVDWGAVAHADTLVLFMAVKTLPEVTAQLVACGRDPATPAAAIRWGTTAAQRTVVGTLGDLAARVAEADLRPPALIVVGEVVRFRERLSWYERRPLFGARVLVPRQREQARGFGRLLAQLGAEPIICEVTRIVPGDREALDAAVARAVAGAVRWIAFTSAPAVDHTLQALARLGRDVRALAGVRLAAVGDATAAALGRHGLRADLVPPSAKHGTGLAHAMLAADPGLPGSAVLLPRAEEGREELAQALAAAGVAVTLVAAYRTVPAPPADLEPTLARLRGGEVDVLTFFSPSQVEALAGALAAEAVDVLNRARLIAAIGATTADALRVRRIRVDLVPSAPSAETLAAELVSRYSR
jgi:uroporphyrinogen III methyltransferase / synthase